MVKQMQDVMIITSTEWVLLALVSFALINSAIICINLRKNLIRSEARQSFDGLTGALSALGKRTNRKAAKTRF